MQKSPASRLLPLSPVKLILNATWNNAVFFRSLLAGDSVEPESAPFAQRTTATDVLAVAWAAGMAPCASTLPPSISPPGTRPHGPKLDHPSNNQLDLSVGFSEA